MIDSPLKEQLDIVARNINDMYNVELIVPPHSMSDDSLNAYWNERTKVLLPNSFAYIFDYTRQCFIKSKNLQIIGADQSIKPLKYLEKYIPEQQMFIAYEMYSVVMNIFSPFHQLFKTGEYYYVADRIIKDHLGIMWHCHVIIEPLVFDSTGKLISYFSTVILCDKDLGIPYRSEIRSKILGHKNESPIFKTLTLFHKKIKLEMVCHLEFSAIEIEILKLFSEAKNSSYIADKFGWGVKNVNRYSGIILSQIEYKLEILYKTYKQRENVDARGIANFLKQMDFI